MKKGKLRVGVVGLGIGKSHIAGYLQHRRAQVVAIADPDAGRLREAGDQFGIPGRYADADTLLEKEAPDVLSVAVPNRLHKELTLAGFRAGCHVLCEKPMAMNAREGRAMVEAARKADRRLMINFSQRFSAASRQLRREVDRGALGDVYFARSVWHRQRGMPRFGGWFGIRAQSGGGPMIDLGVHRLDLALWLMGHPEPEWVLASTHAAIAPRLAREQGKSFDVEDLAAGFVRFRNGATLIVEASWAANIADREMMETRLMGNRGGLLQRNVEGGYRYEAETYVERADGRVAVRRLRPPIRPARPSYYHFVDAILKGEPHIATGEEGLAVSRILDALYRSAERGRPVQV